MQETESYYDQQTPSYPQTPINNVVNEVDYGGAILSEPEIRQAIKDSFKNKSCFDSGPADKMVITAITPCPAHRYILETCVEQRQYLARQGRPDKGDRVKIQTPLPDMWSIPLQVPTNFPAEKELDFRNTESIVVCPTCTGSGFIICPGCGGLGYTDYYGRMVTRPIVHSHRHTCYNCGARGQALCPHCEGRARIVTWKYLKVSWVLITKIHNTVRGVLTQENLDQARYTKTELTDYTKVPDKITPINFPADQEITDVARKLVADALVQNNWKVISARQSVVTVPVLEVRYQYDGRDSVFYVYGEGRSVFFPQGYPSSCCGGCCSIV